MIVVTLGVAAVSAVLIKVLGLPQRSFLPALTLGNTGNLGLPLCLFAFGEEGLGLAVAIYVTNSLLQFTFVPLLQTRVSIVRTLFTTPMLYGAAAGLAVLLSGVRRAQLARDHARVDRRPADPADADGARQHGRRPQGAQLAARVRPRAPRGSSSRSSSRSA